VLLERDRPIAQVAAIRMAVSPPQLTLPAGLAIGYRSPLARTRETIELGPGNHFLLARNGRGKTTLLRTLARTIKQVEGELERQGRIQYVPEDLRFDAELPAASILRALVRHDRRDAAFQLAERLELDLDKPYGKLSTGNRRKTSLIAVEFALTPGAPNILLLDEPLSGLDAAARGVFEEIWRDHGNEVLRLVSCHPDYDSMEMDSALLISSGEITHTARNQQTWSDLKHLLN